VAMPVSVATLPIGSLVVEGADESAGAGVAGVGAGGVCALAVTAIKSAPTSEIASQSL